MNINEFARALKSYVESQPSKSENGDSESLLELLFDALPNSLQRTARFG